MTTQPTPGPTLHRSPCCSDAAYYDNARDRHGWVRCGTHAESSQDRVFAAAPRMLEALREIVRRYDELSTGRTNAHIQFQNEVEPARALLREIHGEGQR